MAKYNDINKQISDKINNRGLERDALETDLNTKYGVDDRINTINAARKTAANTERALTALPQNIKQRGAGRLMTQGQRDRWQAAETEPLARASSELNRTVDVENQGLNLVNSMVKNKLDAQAQDFGFNIDNLSKMRSDAFAQENAANDRAFQKSMAGTNFANQKNLLTFQNDLDTTKQNGYLAALEKYNGGAAKVNPLTTGATATALKNLPEKMANTGQNKNSLLYMGAQPVGTSAAGDIYVLPNGKRITLTGSFQNK